MNKTSFKGTMEGYIKVFDLIDIAKDEMYHIGYGLQDIPYFISDKEVISSERNIHKELENKLDELYNMLNSITGSNRKYNYFRNKY